MEDFSETKTCGRATVSHSCRLLLSDEVSSPALALFRAANCVSCSAGESEALDSAAFCAACCTSLDAPMSEQSVNSAQRFDKATVPCD